MRRGPAIDAVVAASLTAIPHPTSRSSQMQMCFRHCSRMSLRSILRMHVRDFSCQRAAQSHGSPRRTMVCCNVQRLKVMPQHPGLHLS
jgi:hypothetical protein